MDEVHYNQLYKLINSNKKCEWAENLFWKRFTRFAHWDFDEVVRIDPHPIRGPANNVNSAKNNDGDCYTFYDKIHRAKFVQIYEVAVIFLAQTV